MLSVSVIIPARNEEQYISKCIDSILSQTYDQNLISVFVCDGLSSDKTQEIVNEYCQKHQNIHLLINEEQTTPHALNLGLKSSDTDVKIILGAHAELAASYIQNCIDILNDKPEVWCVGGVLENVYENKVSEAIGLAMSSRFGVGNAAFRVGAEDGHVDTVAFGAYRKEVFEEIGYFDEDLIRNQDDEFNYRVTKNGGKIYLSNMIRSKYYVRASFKKLWKQYYQYGYWKVFVNQKHSSVTTVRQLIPMLFVLFVLSAPVWKLLALQNLYFIVLSLYLLVALIAAFITGSLAKVFISFLILHFSYGLGYLEGIWKFVILGKKPSRISLSR